MKKPCAFCTLAPTRVIAENELAMVVRDAVPVSPKHTLVIPHRHVVGSFFDLTDSVQSLSGGRCEVN